MTDNEYGPFDSERQALATRSAALIRAAFDAHPGVGASVPESLKVMTDACEAAGVDLGKLDLSFLQGVAWGETFYSVSLAGMIARAAEPPSGTETEWAVRMGRSQDVTSHDEDTARRMLAMLGENGTPAVLYRREVGPWIPASDEPATGEGNDAPTA
jgi:hypothetical protein